VGEEFQRRGEDALALGELLDAHGMAMAVATFERILRHIFHILTSQSQPMTFSIVAMNESTVVETC
jgi:hypothetical protein